MRNARRIHRMVAATLLAFAMGMTATVSPIAAASSAAGAEVSAAAAGSGGKDEGCRESDDFVHIDCLKARKILTVSVETPKYGPDARGRVEAAARNGRFKTPKPVKGLAFELYSSPDDGSAATLLSTTLSERDGTFAFSDLTPGCHTIVSEGANGARFDDKAKTWEHRFCVLPPKFCAGQIVTVYIEEGDQPTSGSDVILGTDGPDDIELVGGSDTVCGGDGADVIRAASAGVRILGGPGDDRITGGPAADSVSGGPGDDIISGGGGTDQIEGGPGNDLVSGDAGNDRLYGNEGADRLDGGPGNDLAIGGGGNDAIQGGEGDDLLSGESGDDSLDGDDGNDMAHGGPGRDLITGGDGDDDLVAGHTEDGDTVDGGAGNDIIEGSEGADILSGGEGDDRLNGGGDDDRLYGGTEAGELAGSDSLDGGDGNDQLMGQAGDDELVDGPGDDVLEGGDGDDRLAAGAGENRMVGGSGADLFVEPRGAFTVEPADRIERNYTDSALGGFPETCRTARFVVPGAGSFDCEIPWFLFEHTSAELSYEWGLDVFFDCGPDGVIIGDRCFSPPPPVQTFLDGTEPHHGHFRAAYRTYRSWGLRRPFTIEPYRDLDSWPEATTIGALFTADTSFGSRSTRPGIIEYGRNPDLSRRAVHRDLFKQFAFSYLTADLSPAGEFAVDSLADWAAAEATNTGAPCSTTLEDGCTIGEALDGSGRLLWEYMLERKGNRSFIRTFLTFLNSRTEPTAAADAVLGRSWQTGFTTWANTRISGGGVACPAPCGAVEPLITRSYAYPVGGVVTRGTVGRAAVRTLGGQLVAGLAAEALVQYFQTFDLDSKINDTMAAHLFPMLADLPQEDLRITVSEYEFVPWIEPEIKPYEDDPSDCLRWVPALGPGMRAFIQRRATNRNLAQSATIAVALYCIDEKMGAAASRSGGLGAAVPDMPGLAFDPATPETLAAFGRTGPLSPNHAETNLLASLIVGVPIRQTSVGVIYMLVDNPAAGEICGACLDVHLSSFQERYPGVRLSVIARNNAFQNGRAIVETDPSVYDGLLNG